MLDAIDQGHRDLVPVVEHVLFRARDVALLPPDVQVGRDLDDDLPGRVAQVAAGAAEQGDHRWRTACRTIIRGCFGGVRRRRLITGRSRRTVTGRCCWPAGASVPGTSAWTSRSARTCRA